MAFQELTPEKVHEGNNVKLIRETLNISLEEIANDLKIPLASFEEMEKRKEIESDQLKRIAEKLGVPVKLIKNLPVNAPVNFITDNEISYSNIGNGIVTINNGSALPDMEKYIKAMENFLQVVEEQKKEIAKKNSEIKELKARLEDK